MHTKYATDFEPIKDNSLGSSAVQPLWMRLAALPSKNMLYHGDYHVFNLINSKDKAFIIDWVDSDAGNPGADACCSYMIYSLLFPDLADSYLHLYCEKMVCIRTIYLSDGLRL